MPDQVRLADNRQPPAVALRQMIRGFRTTQLIYVAAKLGIAAAAVPGHGSSYV